MKHSLLAFILMLGLSGAVLGQSDIEAEASAVFEQFLTSMTNTDVDAVVSLFTKDALFWGTGSQSLVTDTAGISQYFAAVGQNEPGQNIARAVDYSVDVFSDELVLISGMWEVVQCGENSGIPLRVSMVIALQDGQWKIIQFHNSRVPE